MTARTAFLLLIVCLSAMPCMALNVHDRIANRLSLPTTYTGDTPYKGYSFRSSNLTLPLRIQRDIAMNVTIDRHLWPALDLSNAYFGNDYSAQRLSDVEQVLYMGYRRLVVDIYWDSKNRNWQLCPQPITTNMSSLTASLHTNLNNRTSSSSTSTTTTSITNETTTTLSNVHNHLVFHNGTFALSRAELDDVQLDSVRCAPWYNFRHFMDSVNHFLTTADLSNAPEETDLIFIILNLHQLDSSSNINGNDTASSISRTIKEAIVSADNNAPRIYTPANLTRDRRNLTDSFGTTGMPYYQPSIDPETGALTSNTAWPPWYYLIERRVQLLVGFGYNHLPVNTNYNVTDDADMIFNATELGAGWYMNEMNLTDMQAMQWSDCARPGNHTFMLPSGNETAVSQSQPQPGDTLLSWSWANMNDHVSAFDYDSTLQAVQCGYSPYFTQRNYTQPNDTYSANDTRHLADNILGTIWSWDVNQPEVKNTPQCAMMQQWNGRWRTGDCTKLLRVACRRYNDPNKWMLTSTFVSYDRAFAVCPENYVFDCPRTSQQNYMLFRVTQQDLLQNGPETDGFDDPLHHLFWINLNSASDSNCWVVGLYASCWWLNEASHSHTLSFPRSANFRFPLTEWIPIPAIDTDISRRRRYYPYSCRYIRMDKMCKMVAISQDTKT